MQDVFQTVALAHLARLEISSDRAEKFSQQLDAVLGYVSMMQGATHTTSTASDIGTPLALDNARNDQDPLSIDRASLMEAVPVSLENLIKVRAVL